jgi:hypothetical protein
VEFAVITLQRSLNLSEKYQALTVGALKIGLQGIQEDVAEIEIQGQADISRLRIPKGTVAHAQGYSFICLDVGVAIPEEPKRRLFGRKKSDIPPNGVMEAVLDVRWGDQALAVPAPQKNTAYDFRLVRQYEILNDRPLVYNDQDTLVFGDLALMLGEREEEGSRNYKKPRYASFRAKFKGGDEELLQIDLDDKYHKVGDYRIKITSFDIYNEWYQAVGISIAEGRIKGEMDETERAISGGISPSDVGSADNSRTRLDEAKANPNEMILSVGQTENIGKVSIKLLELKPGVAKLMFLSPKIARTTLEHGQVFDFGNWDVSLMGVYGDKAIIRVEEDK